MRSGRGSSDGYSLVVVVMLIAVMSILVAAVLPLASTQVQRSKEEDLISRGLQYAEAIRVFQRRFGRLPVRLEELVEVEPRSIRRLWKDPMTNEVNWVRIYEGVPAGGQPVDPATGLPLPDPDGDGVPGEGENSYVGPIRGVRSRVDKESILVFLDQSNYSAWEFRSDIYQRYNAAPSENGIPRVSALTIGRPFRFPLPGGGKPGGKPSQLGPKPPEPPRGGGIGPNPGAPPAGGGVGPRPPGKPNG
ncbi:MAG: type II secretion system protein [Thermoanaerobaculia bacterium]